MMVTPWPIPTSRIIARQGPLLQVESIELMSGVGNVGVCAMLGRYYLRTPTLVQCRKPPTLMGTYELYPGL